MLLPASSSSRRRRSSSDSDRVLDSSLTHASVDTQAAQADKDYDRAIACYNRAIEIKPNYASAYYNRGLAYSAKGDKGRAIVDYRKSHEFFIDLRDRDDAWRQLRRLGVE